jgi:surfeit locus 1 family protein
MQIGQRQFKPSLIGTVVTLLMLPGLMSLGFWQLRRADEKQALIERLHEGANTTQTVSASNVEGLPLLQTVTARGRYDSDRQLLLDNMWSTKNAQVDGKPVGVQPGMNVLTPLLLEDGHIILVNRGWQPFGRTRADLPNIKVDGDPRTVRGLISSVPEPGMRIGDTPNPSTTWPRLMNYPKLVELKALYGDRLLPRLLLLDGAEPDGFERDWTTRYNFSDFGPDRHVGYAVQWFGLAFALLIIYVVVSLKPTEQKEA